jgi:hypothetical protein
MFAVQIGRFDTAPSVTILCKFNDRPAEVHSRAAKTGMRYLRRTIEPGLIFWRPKGKERSDLPRGALTPIRLERDIATLFPDTHSLLESVCYADASYGGLLVLGNPCSVTGVMIMIGDTAIFARTRIQRTMLLSVTESEIVAGCDAGKVIKYFSRLHLPEKIMRAQFTWNHTIGPAAARGTWTYRTSPPRNGPNAASWSFSRSMAQPTWPMPCPRSSTESSLPATSTVCKATMAHHTQTIPCFAPTRTITPLLVECLSLFTHCILHLSCISLHKRYPSPFFHCRHASLHLATVHSGGGC